MYTASMKVKYELKNDEGMAEKSGRNGPRIVLGRILLAWYWKSEFMAGFCN